MGRWRRGELQRRFRSGIIYSSRIPWIRTFYRKACQLGTWVVGRQLASLQGVEAVYVRHSHPRSVTFAPGQSDLDLTVVLDDEAAQNASLVRACTRARADRSVARYGRDSERTRRMDQDRRSRGEARGER